MHSNDGYNARLRDSLTPCWDAPSMLVVSAFPGECFTVTIFTYTKCRASQRPSPTTSLVTPTLLQRLTPLHLPLYQILRIDQLPLQLMASIAEFALIALALPDLSALHLRDRICKSTVDAFDGGERFAR
ncbi:hypothetical protein PHSY_000680 [Pseudozyma hubeiensis SY62]|uniref:Uncharacterized protein n=1 Tax=Pseudozyma hubeiensis (strain SY62) TaxID=1305764 RepID=R9NWW2_PSEHS|nr:hypothetical protein PHSY_000680 [Pseudozyma hubeiensis SY62]GAC93118.1 hypothetical protein PHSY_000680 [Pseudozyma hubeiensis SY62]